MKSNWFLCVFLEFLDVIESVDHLYENTSGVSKES